MKKCPFCGKEIPDEMQFCPYCMERLVPAEKIKPTLIKKRNFRIYGVCAAAAIVLLSGAVLFAVTHHNRKLGVTENPAMSNSDAENSAVSLGDSVSKNNTSDSNRAEQSSDYHAYGTDNVSKASSEDSPSSYSNTAKQNADSSTKGNTTGSNAALVTNTDSCANGHTWVAITKIIHHDAVGHNEQVEVYNEVVKYKCPVCYEKFNSLSEYFTHFDSAHTPSYSGDPISIFRNQYETVSDYDISYENKWVEDKKAYDEIVITGYKCSVCGKTK